MNAASHHPPIATGVTTSSQPISKPARWNAARLTQ
jgi:hypothetical protein